MDPLIYGLVFAISTWVVYSTYRRYTRISLADIPGPKSDSFWLGTPYYTPIYIYNDFLFQEVPTTSYYRSVA